MIWRMARPFSLVLSMGAALIMLACSDKNNTPVNPGPDSVAASAVPAAPGTPAAASGTALAAAPVSTQLPILASGSNPDWSIRIDSSSVTVKGFDGSMALYPPSKAQSTATSTQFSMGGGANVATLTLARGPCVDSPISAMNAAVRINGRSGSGCALHPENPRPAGPSADWVTALFDYIPAMRACLARGEAERAYANDVEHRADNSVSMRLRYADATQFTCSSATGSQVNKFEAVVEPSESLIETPAFALSAAAFATLGCEEAPIEVFGSAGEPVGYLQRGTCANSTTAVTP
jgi:uncharacterized membrane protein